MEIFVPRVQAKKAEKRITGFLQQSSSQRNASEESKCRAPTTHYATEMLLQWGWVQVSGKNSYREGGHPLRHCRFLLDQGCLTFQGDLSRAENTLACGHGIIFQSSVTFPNYFFSIKASFLWVFKKCCIDPEYVSFWFVLKVKCVPNNLLSVLWAASWSYSDISLCKSKLSVF